jgi:hypothetical protein
LASRTSVCAFIDVVGHLREVEALAVGLAAAVQVDGMDRQPLRQQLPRRPVVIAFVRLDAVHDADDGARRRGRDPRADEDLQPAADGDAFFAGVMATAVPMGVPPGGVRRRVGGVEV